MLSWERLLNHVRRKDLDPNKHPNLGTAAGRTELERDYDRILFSTPTRRLADKTQVFPMDENDSVRTRLTHSFEVSNLARGIGTRLAFEFHDQVFGKQNNRLAVQRNIPAILAAIGLAHDLGNPPFGHQGEFAMQQWFQNLNNKHSIDVDEDFLKFDGNAQTFRLLTRLQILNDSYGLNLTVATLAGLMKYPVIYGSDLKGFKKPGIFQSDRSIAEEVWSNTGLNEGRRHPLTFIMEACDDIAYSVIDAEDTVKKGYASFYDFIDFIENKNSEDPIIEDVISQAKSKNKELKRANISYKELNDLSMQLFRVIAISKMADAATETFVQRIDTILGKDTDHNFELINESSCSTLCRVIKEFDRTYGFQHRDVLKLELQGNHYIKGMMDILWLAVENGNSKENPFARFVYGSISENYRRVYENSPKTYSDKFHLICDTISGMTESYLIKKYQEFRSLQNAPQ